MEYILGIDIGGTFVRYGYVDEEGQIIHFSIKKVETFTRDFVSELVDIILTTNTRFNIVPKAISLGFPSTLDKERRKLVSTPNIEGLDNISIVDKLEKAVNINVIVDRDVNFLFTYDCFSKAVNTDVILGCYIGTGFGNVIAINNQILYGKNGVAGELGHIPVLGNDTLCSCGNTGCIETIASGKALKKLQETFFPDTDIRNIFMEHSSHVEIDSFIKNLAIPIATEVNIFDPDAIIIGGGVVHMQDFPKELLENYVKEYSRKPYPADNLRFIYSDNGQENGVIGAGIFAFNKLKKVSKK